MDQNAEGLVDRRADDSGSMRGRFELIPKWLPVVMALTAVLLSATMAWGANLWTNTDQNKRLDFIEKQASSTEILRQIDHDTLIGMKEQIRFLAERAGYTEKR